MESCLKDLVFGGDEIALENAYFDNICPQFFVVDWRENDEYIAEYAATALGLNSLSARWVGDQLHITYEDKTVIAPLIESHRDRVITICTLNEMLFPKYELRYMVVSQGSDTYGFAAATSDLWQELETRNPVFIEENFVDPKLLRKFEEDTTFDFLSEPAKKRYQRMIERYRKK